MKVICSWCESEGRPALVREKAPLTDGRETHGICFSHLQQVGIGRDPLVPSVMKRDRAHGMSLWWSAEAMREFLPCGE